jgi:hypothetical protein
MGSRRVGLRYRVPMTPAGNADKARDAAAEAEAVRLSRLRKDAQRPMSVNLAETIALSHQLLKFAGAAHQG